MQRLAREIRYTKTSRTGTRFGIVYLKAELYFSYWKSKVISSWLSCLVFFVFVVTIPSCSHIIVSLGPCSLWMGVAETESSWYLNLYITVTINARQSVTPASLMSFKKIIGNYILNDQSMMTLTMPLEMSITVLVWFVWQVSVTCDPSAFTPQKRIFGQYCIAWFLRSL